MTEARATAQGAGQGRFDVSVLIAAYNAEETLERAVLSALYQTGCSVEVIVIDDASNDGTLACARALAARFATVRALTTGRNAGPSAARNLGLDVLRGEFVAVLDSDDFMDPGRLSRLLSIARVQTWDFVADDLYRVVEGSEGGARTTLFDLPQDSRQIICLAEFVAGNLTSYNGARGEMGFLKPLMSARFIASAQLRYREDMRLGEDYAFYAEALVAGGRFCLVGPAGYVGVVRADSLSGRHDAAALAALVRADDDLLQTPGLSLRERDVLKAHRIDTMKRWSWLRLIEAVKARKIGEAVRSFGVPLPVAWNLVLCLGEQIVLRTSRQIRARLARARLTGESG